ncbi:hypothetical protein C8J57DRAFT_1478650 [Mycena rebaudengoi]|nr:hypothetical protein C8J57DRAFT_1478650 [Mycena rebaudengoi]
MNQQAGKSLRHFIGGLLKLGLYLNDKCGTNSREETSLVWGKCPLRMQFSDTHKNQRGIKVRPIFVAKLLVLLIRVAKVLYIFQKVPFLSVVGALILIPSRSLGPGKLPIRRRRRRRMYYRGGPIEEHTGTVPTYTCLYSKYKEIVSQPSNADRKK